MKGVTWKANSVRTGNRFQSQCATKEKFFWHWRSDPLPLHLDSFYSITLNWVSKFLYSLRPPLKNHNRKVRKYRNPWTPDCQACSFLRKESKRGVWSRLYISPRLLGEQGSEELFTRRAVDSFKEEKSLPLRLRFALFWTIQSQIQLCLIRDSAKAGITTSNT
jgi:hypothetical protein